MEALEVTYDDNQCWMSLKAKNLVGTLAEILIPLNSAGIPVDCTIQDEDSEGYAHLNFTVPRTDVANALAILEKIGNQVAEKNIMNVVRVRLDTEGTNAGQLLESVIGAFYYLHPFDVVKDQVNGSNKFFARLLIKDEDFPQAVRILRECFHVQNVTRVNRFVHDAVPASIRGNRSS